MSIEAAEAVAAAAVATKAPDKRITLADIEHNIVAKHLFNLSEALTALGHPVSAETSAIMTVCVLELRNGFVVIGKSAPIFAENYDTQLGERFAYEDAVKQVWPLMGYSAKDHLHEYENGHHPWHFRIRG